MIDENLLISTIMKSGSSYQIPSARTVKGAPSGGKKMTSFTFCKEITLSRNCSVNELKVMIYTIWHAEFKLTYGHFKSWTYHSWSWKPKHVIVHLHRRSCRLCEWRRIYIGDIVHDPLFVCVHDPLYLGLCVNCLHSYKNPVAVFGIFILVGLPYASLFSDGHYKYMTK